MDYSFTAAKPDKQFKRALEIKTAHTVKLERNTAGELTVKIKNLQDRAEAILSPEAAIESLSARKR